MKGNIRTQITRARWLGVPLLTLMISAASIASDAQTSGAMDSPALVPYAAEGRDVRSGGSGGGSGYGMRIAQVAAGAEEQIYDTTPPVSTAVVTPPPTPHGWNNTDVAVTVTAYDEESGIRETVYSLNGAQTGGASIYSGIASFEITAEGVTTIRYSARDNADNQENSRFLTVRIDKTPPRVGLTCPPRSVLGTTATATVSATDALSGVASQTVPNGAVLLDTSAVGQGRVTVAVRDSAGNSATETCSYQVVYDFAGAGGFKPPVVSPPRVNAVRAGRTLPIAWQLPDGGGGAISDLSAVVNVDVQQVRCSELAVADAQELPTVATGSSSVLHYDGAANHFVYYWKTEVSMRGNCYVLTLSLDDGTEHPAHFVIR